jgi:hypothetical protein
MKNSLRKFSWSNQINFQENNKKLIEQVLIQTLKDLLAQLRMNLAEWDLKDPLRQVLKQNKNLDKLKYLCDKYDDTIMLADRSKVKLEDKYKYLYKLLD